MARTNGCPHRRARGDRSECPHHILVLGLDANTLSSAAGRADRPDPHPPPLSSRSLGLTDEQLHDPVGACQEEELPSWLVPAPAGADFSEFRCVCQR